MALFDNLLFNPQSYNGTMDGWLQQALRSGLLGNAAPAMGPQIGPTYAKGDQGMMGGVPFPIAPGPEQQTNPQAIPPNAQPAGPAAPAPQMQPPAQLMGPPQGSQDILSRLSAAAHNIGGKGVIPGLLDAFQGLATGQRLDPQGMQLQQMQATYQALINSNVPPAMAQAAALNPEILKTIAPAYFDTKPQFGKIGQDQVGRDIYGFIKPQQEKVIPANAGPNAANATNTNVNPDLHGEEFLKTLPPAIANQVKMIAEGRAPYPSGFIMKTPYGQYLTQAISQYDPGTTAQDYSTKLATAKAFDVGTEAKALKAVNQTILHAQTLMPIIDKLGNSTYLPGALNPVKQMYKSQADPEYQNNLAQFKNTVNALASEATKAFRGNSGAIQDVEHWRKTMNENASPETLKGGVQALMKLLGGAIDSLGSQYNKGMRSNKEPLELVDPKNREIYQKLLGGDVSPPAGPNPVAPSAPKIDDVQAGYRFRGGDPADPKNWVKVQ